MFRKVITTDDLDSINIAVIHTLQELGIQEVQHAKYCDETFLKIKKAQIDAEPFDLLISDLSFKNDHRNEKLQSGEELIRAVKVAQPNLKVLVYSIEDKTHRLKNLIENEGINGYVLKGRNSIPELKKAIQSIYSNDTVFISPSIANQIGDKSMLEIGNYDIELLKALSKGFTQDEIVHQFKNNKIVPCGSSSIEKRINKLKIFFRANNNAHLITITKDLGLI
ncbi:response regulator [Flavobacterium sp.]|uniref:response regulator n=1 Tax=Flavobacterium sp. TaxID=239 RepID=UPI0038FCAB24